VDLGAELGLFEVDEGALPEVARRVRLAEQQGQLLSNAIRAILGDLNLTPDQQALVSTVVPNRLRELSASAASN
jgi:hypothetical protein